MKIKLRNILKNKINIGKRIPLRKWSIDWKLPDKCRIEKYKAILNIKGKKVEVERFRLLGKMSNLTDINTKKWYKGSSTRGLDYVKEDGYIWCILKSNFPFKLEISSLQLSTDGDWLYFTVPINSMGIWYKYGNGRINFFIIPKKLKLNDKFWEVFGILQGEMLQKGRGIKVSNCEPKIVNLLLEFFDKNRFITKDMWDITVSINSKNMPKDKRQQFCDEIKKYWSVQLGLPINRIRSIYWYDQFNSTLNPNYGEINLWFDNASLRKVIDSLLIFVKHEVLKNKDYAIPFLRGLSAAEGNVSINKSGRLLEIRLSAKKLEDRILYKKICESIGISATCETNHHHVRICGLLNFLIILENDILALHEKKKNDFLLSLEKFQTIQTLYCLLESPRAVPELVRLLSLNDYRNLNKNLSRLATEGFLTRKGTKRGYVYSIKPLLKRLLNKLKTLTLNNP